MYVAGTNSSAMVDSDIKKRTSVVAFVASWCGVSASLSGLRPETNVPVVFQYCKAMVPEYSKAAVGLHPLIPLYAVDCDENRSLCAEQARLSVHTVFATFLTFA
jgi:protein disulfide-isomerase A6